MELHVRRLFVRDSSMIGALSVVRNGVVLEPECFTLEDLPRDVKIAGQTCIPVGRYELRLRVFGRLYERYRARYPWNEPGMLWLQAVPQFTDVLIHCGSTDNDTAGCLLLGDRVELYRPALSQSLAAYERVYKRVSDALLKGERCWIEVASNVVRA